MRNFEAQIFPVAVTLLRNVGKILPPPPYTKPGAAPGVPHEPMESHLRMHYKN